MRDGSKRDGFLHEEPHGAALLDAARQALVAEITPALEGRPRYVALMVANAIGIVARELAQSERSARAWDAVLAPVAGPDGPDAAAARLVAAIRAGAHDADPALHDALTETTAIAAEVRKPTGGRAG